MKNSKKMNDIQNDNDIKTLVDHFYSQVRMDHILAPVFNSRIGNEWENHLEKMYDFWATLLLNSKSYSGNPFAKHQNLPIERIHFDRWLNHFVNAVDKHFRGPIADEAKERAKSIAHIFYSKIKRQTMR